LKYYTEGTGTASEGTASIDIITADYTTFNRFDATPGEGYILTGVKDFATGNYTEADQKPNSYFFQVVDTPTLSTVSSLFLQNNASEGYSQLNVVGTTKQTILNLDPSTSNGGTFFKQQSTVGPDYAFVEVNSTSMDLEVSSGTNTTNVSISDNFLALTPDNGTSTFTFYGTPLKSTGLLEVAGDSLVKYTQTEWTSVGFDASTLITKGYIDYLGLSASSLHKVLGVGNTSSLTIELEGFTSSSTTPAYSFQSFSQSGIYHAYQHPFTSRVGIAVSGATSGLFKNGGLAVQDGVSGQPGYHFINDVDTGIFRSATNELSISVGGLTAATFFVGSSRAGIKTPVYSTIVSSNVSVSGTFTQSLSDANNYTYTLTGNTTFSYSNPTQSVYNFLVKAGTYSFTLDAASNWQTVGATALGFTGSFVMSAIYDGTDMWVSTVRNYQSY
jgi:hypothetical protein